MAASQKERLTWEQLVLTIAEKKFAALGRDATTLAAYRKWLQVLNDEFVSVEDYVFQRVFGFPVEDVAVKLSSPSGEIFLVKLKRAVLDVTKLSGNGVSSNAVRTPHSANEQQSSSIKDSNKLECNETSLASAYTREQLQKLLSQARDKLPQMWRLMENDFPYYFDSEIRHSLLWSIQELTASEIQKIMEDQLSREYEWIWFCNPPNLKSVKNIVHVHVMWRLKPQVVQGNFSSLPPKL